MVCIFRGVHSFILLCLLYLLQVGHTFTKLITGNLRSNSCTPALLQSPSFFFFLIYLLSFYSVEFLFW